MMLILTFFSYLWIRIQVTVLRLIYICRFRYVQYQRRSFLPKPSLIENIFIDNHSIRALIYLPPQYSSDAAPYPLHIDFHGGIVFSRSRLNKTRLIL